MMSGCKIDANVLFKHMLLTGGQIKLCFPICTLKGIKQVTDRNISHQISVEYGSRSEKRPVPRSTEINGNMLIGLPIN